jgi:hypothetical protein
VKAAQGRMISEMDDSPSADPVAVISHRYWQHQLGLDPNIVGKTIYLNKLPVTVVGVSSAEFTGASNGRVSPTSR